jgi:hypothetical protein
MNLKLLGAVALAAACLAAGYALGIGPFRPPLELDHERFYSIKAEIRATPTPIIVFGDSIVRGATLPAALCGYPVVNAGVVGASVGYFQRHAEELLGSTHPAMIILAVGINDASPMAAREFQSSYRKVVASLSRVAPIAVATITPVRDGTGSEGYDATLIPSLNDAIRTTPNTKAVIDLNEPLSAANWTTDGIHLGSAGYDLWTNALIDGISNALGCAKSR